MRDMKTAEAISLFVSILITAVRHTIYLTAFALEKVTNTTLNSVNLRSKIIYNVLMLSISIKSVLDPLVLLLLCEKA